MFVLYSSKIRKCIILNILCSEGLCLKKLVLLCLSLKINLRLFVLSEGVKNISNQLTIGSKISAEHLNLRRVAQTQGWWSGEGEFSFTAAFSPDNPPARMEMAKQRYKGGTALLQQHDGKCTLI